MKIFNKIYHIVSSCYYRYKLPHFGIKSCINHPIRVAGNVSIGNYVNIQYKSWIEAQPLTGYDNPCLKINDGCVIGHFNEIYATKSVIIEKDVLTADRVYISDNLHGYKDIKTPILKQPIIQNGNGVVIGEGSWLGVGVCVLGASIGKHCVIGSNAVVTKDIPDFCIAAGIPARIIKRYDFDLKEWRATNPDGSFK